jgi:photosystem II stability/assembly factor-like uncharacterized protein
MKKLSFILSLSLLSNFIQAQTFEIQTLNAGVGDLYNCVYFNNDTNGYIGSQNGDVYKTNDGGLNWTNLGRIQPVVRSIYFIDENTGFTAGDSGIYKTTNGGLNWTKKFTGYLRSVKFFNKDTGYAAGHVGIIKTTDGGENWTNCFNETFIDFLFIQNDKTIYAPRVEYPFDSYYKSSDAGNSWTRIYVQGLKNGVRSIYFVDTDTGFIGESGKTVLKTTNASQSWNTTYIDSPFSLNGFYFLNKNTAYAIGVAKNINSIISYTSDGGNNWTEIYDTSDIVFTDIYFPNSNVGYAVGNLGTIKKITVTNNVSVNKLPVEVSATVYPNPSNGHFNITLPPQTKEVLIYNSHGKLVNKAITDGLTGMDYYITCKGIYLIQIVTENQIINRKLIVSD